MSDSMPSRMTPEPPASDLTAESAALKLNDERARVLSPTRLKLAFTLFVVTTLAALSMLTFLMVTRIFDRLTPSTRHDLEWKAQRGALELAQTAELAMVVGDSEHAKAAAHDYVQDPEVTQIVIQDADGKTVYVHEKHDAHASATFVGEPGRAHDVGVAFSAWAPALIEGAAVGKVALVVSKARLAAGQQLREDILSVGAIGAAIALVLTLLFVNLYIGPILRMTTSAFARLERTTEAALAATRMKSEFLANMSHEVRTPMNGILGVLDLFAHTTLSGKQIRYLQTMESSARSLLTIINDILDFSKLEAGKYEIRHDEVEVRQVVQEVAELMAPKAHARGIELLCQVEQDVPFSVIGDVDRLKQILTNLLGNAVKFTERGHVLLRVEREANDAALTLRSNLDAALTLRFSVEDTGPGIDAQDLSKLFGVFSQVDGTLTRKHGGTGLGLAICKRLAEAMGGAVGVTSVLGKGSTFWFNVVTRTGSLAPTAEPQPTECRVLLLSGDELQQRGLSRFMSRWGMEPRLVTNASQGRELLMADGGEPFDVVVIDTLGSADDAEIRHLVDVCALEGVPLVRLIGTTDTPPEGIPGLPQVLLTKPIRVSELYNGIVSVIAGKVLDLSRRNAAESPISRRQDSSARVLIVDDNEINRLVAMDLVTALGYACEAVDNGVQALEAVSSGAFAAVLMDCQMPVMDGYEATRRIRALPGPEAATPIIAVTAHAMAGDRDRVLAAGMDDYTSKPVRARALERVLQRWVDDREQSARVALKATATDASAQDAASTSTPGTQPPSWSDAPALEQPGPLSPRIVRLFVDAAPDQVAQIREAMHTGQSDATRRAAHKLKGSCLAIGARRMAGACAHIEDQATQGSLDRQTLDQLDALLRELTPSLEALAPRTHPSHPPPAE
jgi:signal transduction histidine kinase/CheY-like chemotaxis protein/HPt (histidine-containing phosphotransfer) domain-containing protein